MTSYKYQKQHASNYNYKTKRSFGQRLKNFFTIPEEDLKEEPSKEFEKIKLFTLTRGSLFLGILVFMILINILVGFNINFLYLRQIFGFLFLILIPGLLIILCFKIRTVKFWEYLVYTVGLSIAFIMFAGLAVNWTLPALNITDKPLSLWPILICFDIFLLGLWLTAIYRNKDLKPFDITIPKLDTINRIFFIIPMIFPLLSILGAFLLNNHGPNILTMIMLGGIAVYVLLLVLFRKHMNENVWPWAILLISISILMMGWMRSWYVSGIDINLEYSLFQLTKEEGIWRLHNMPNNYDAMLSLTILPAILSLFMNINDHLLLKFIFPILFSLVPIIVYYISKIYFKEIFCFLGSLFFISQRDFLVWLTIPFRQQVAFIFFSLMILIVLTRVIDNKSRKLFFVFFGASMIVSHYATGYLALGIFTLTYILSWINKNIEKRKIKKGKLAKYEATEYYLTGFLILLLILFGFLWYSQVTPTGEGLVSFMGNSFSNLENIFKEDVQVEGEALLDRVNLFNNQRDYLSKFKYYIEEYPNEYTSKYSQLEFYNKSEYLDSKINFKLSKTLPYKIDYNFISIILYFQEIIKFILGKVLIIFGVVSLFFVFKKDSAKREYLFISTSFLLLLFFVVIIPFGTFYYNLDRAYQQVLILLSIQTIFGLFLIFRMVNIKKSEIYISILIILYFLLFSGFINQLIGTKDVSPSLNNFGDFYDKYFSHKNEINSGSWVNLETSPEKVISADSRSQSRLYLSNLKWNLAGDILPSLIGKNNYLYLSYSNINEDITFKPFKGLLLSYTFPNDFFNKNKDKVYNNGGSIIFK